MNQGSLQEILKIGADGDSVTANISVGRDECKFLQQILLARRCLMPDRTSKGFE
ncbi:MULTISPECIES: hypothetical protein [Microcoleaceae]|uniref:hypothetical protein n=1 Tax=Microcoleaceae TaxID=1892252 RepID=UPI00187EAEAA|nr:hypothetical protein [Tychonema sp. LEGE 06208]MBE9161373.1 hypothetical protein [Tychonema sp. LEGE 06208]